jgi:hypothetical protein
MRASVATLTRQADFRRERRWRLPQTTRSGVNDIPEVDRIRIESNHTDGWWRHA